jgi:acetolactate synthase-1/2/3 large subunit
MAEGTWHATGAPGILVATVGPGIANAFNVIANAEQDRVPLIVISGMIDPAEAMRYSHQVFDQSAVLRQVCKASFVAPAGGIGAMIDKAVSIATGGSGGRPGPVHIDLPISVAATDEPQAPSVLRGPPLLSAPAPGPALDRARAMFAAAKRPVVMAGLDVVTERGGDEAVRSFVERHKIPLVTTYKAKGVLPEDHPLALGGHGLSPKSEKIILPLFEAADLVIAAGYDPIEMRIGWQDPWEPGKAIEFAHAPNDHDMHYAGLSWICSVAAGLAALDGEPKGGWPDDTPGRIRAALMEAFAPKGSWGPDHAIAEILAAVPDDVTVTVDTGAHRILLSQMWRGAHQRAMLQSTGLCTMGCALPLAMGFKHARPEAPVIAFTGDAGLEMVLGELSTLRDLDLPVAIVVFTDESLALIELKQRAMGMQNAGVDFRGTDFAALARVYGGDGVTVTGPGEAGPAVTEALAANRFTVVDVRIPRRAYDGLI